MTKAIFFDIDGTLVSFKTHKIPDSTFMALKQLHEKGIKLFIATGRGKDGLDVLKDFPFDGYITLNGQYCYTQDKIIYENTIQKEDLQALLEYLEKQPFPCGFTEEHTKYFNMRDERVDEIHRITHNDDHPAGDCSQVIHHKVYQCMCFVDEQEEKTLLKVMPHCISARWHPLFCDVSPVGGTKQNGIDQFLKYYDIDLSETMAFGDGGNDIPMLKHVAISIAMGNANENVKEIANYVTDDVEHDGIIKALKHFNLL
ncbi:MAG: Cof-type HAD-IIB family hydrolase [Coprobacillus cateniformis]|uniref:Cof-type HAD-IIB family hydrolase n=1 Tax=Longibaculum muris TaxID=1796628 RepID=UPI003AB157C4|nr:Cof-type HAD-IIB family hydrolase [Coprobacillus cateniformis]